MNLNPVSAVADLVKSVLDRAVVDKSQAAEIALKVDEMAATGALAELDAYKSITLAQIDVNKIEAASADKFTSRARPTVVYAGAAALVYGFILQPLLVWAFPAHPFPALDLAIFRDLIFGMLGIYTAGRSAEKITSIVKAPK